MKARFAVLPLALLLSAGPAARAVAQDEAPNAKEGDGPGVNNDPGNYEAPAGDDAKMDAGDAKSEDSGDAKENPGTAVSTDPPKTPDDGNPTEGGDVKDGGDEPKANEKPMVSIKVESDEKPAQADVSVVAPKKKAAKAKPAKLAKAKKAVVTAPPVKKAVIPPPPPPPPVSAVPPTPVEPLNP